MALKALADQIQGFYLPCVTLMGPGCARELGHRARDLGARRVLIVTDPDLHRLGLSGQVAEILSEAGGESFVFAGAEPNPRKATQKGQPPAGGDPVSGRAIKGMTATRGRPLVHGGGIRAIPPGPPGGERPWGCGRWRP